MDHQDLYSQTAKFIYLGTKLCITLVKAQIVSRWNDYLPHSEEDEYLEVHSYMKIEKNNATVKHRVILIIIYGHEIYPKHQML